MASIFCRYLDGTTKICNTLNYYYTTGNSNTAITVIGDIFTDIKVNGVSIGLTTTYNVSSTDEVEFILSGDVLREMAFTGCDTLKSVIIGNGVTGIGVQVFDGCVNLESINIPNSATFFYGSYINQEGSLVIMVGEQFRNCRSLKSVTLPDGLNTLPTAVFEDCSSLKSIIIPNGCEGIGGGAFQSCTLLKTIVIPETVKSVYAGAFENCISLDSIYCKRTVAPSITANYSVDNGIKRNGTLYYPTGSDYSQWLSTNSYYLGYYGWNGVQMNVEDMPEDIPTDPDVPSAISMICRYLDGTTNICYNTDSFSDIKVNGVSIGLTTEYNVNSSDIVEFVLNGTEIGETSFAFRCTGLTSVVIPNSVTIIRDSAFDGCISLTSVVIPDSVTEIGWSAFDGCTSLASVVIPDSVTIIGAFAFEQTILSSVVIPDSVTIIGWGAFSDCYNLRRVTIGSGVIDLYNYAFYNCTNLKNIISYANPRPSVGDNTFESLPFNGTLYYPEGSNYSQWLSTDPYYLGFYEWNGVGIDPDNPDIPTDPDDPDEPNPPVDPDAPSIDLEYDKISAPQGGMNTTIDVETDNVDDMQIVAPDWVDVIEKDGYYEIIIKPNEDGSDRTGEVIFIGNPSRPNKVQQNVIINQNSDNSEMAASISLEKNKITFDNTGYAENFGVKVTYTNAQEIYAPVCSEEWVTITELLPQQGGNTGGDTNATVKRYGFEVTETDIARIATVTFSCKGDTGRVLSNSSFVIEQMGKSEEETNVIVEAFMKTGSVKYDGSSTGISIDSLGCGYSNFASVLAPIVNVDWIHLGEGVLQSGYGYDEIYRYPISFDVNEGAERVGVITFVATDEMGDEYTDTCTITQLAKPYEPDEPEIPEGGDNETYSPIWKDVEYIFGGDDVVYGIYTEKTYRIGNQLFTEDVLVFSGRAYAAPDETVVRVNVNKICQNYMTENPNIFTGNIGYGHSFATFKLKDQYGTLLHTYHFINDWSYDELTVGLKTNPITPYIGDGQKLFFTTFATDEKRINWGMRYYDGTPDYDNQERVSNDFGTLVVAPSREKGVKTFYFGANSFNILPKCQCKYVLYYVNPKGGYDWFTITGRVSRRDRLETYTVTQNYNNTTADFGKKRYLSTINISYQVNTQWLTQEQSNRMWELLESNTVWLHNLEEDKIYPVIITDTEVEHKYKTNSNKMLSYQINLELSHTRERI